MKSFSVFPSTGDATRAAAPDFSSRIGVNHCFPSTTADSEARRRSRGIGLSLIAAVWLCASIKPAQASERDTSTVNLEGITVVANSEGTPLREVGSSVTIVTAEDIRVSQKQSVADVLRDVPGVDVVRTGARGGQTSVFMRGANAGHTLVLVDGVEMNDPSSPNGAYDFADLSVDNIERIEVLRGSQSILYGSDAIGGVIEIFTRNGFGAPTTTLTADYGSYTTSKLSATTSGAKEHVSYSVGVSRTDSRGFSATDSRPNNEPDGYGLTSLSGKLTIRPDEFTQLRFVALSSQSATELDKGFSSFDSPGVFDDLNNRQTSRKSFVKAEADVTGRSSLWRTKVSASLANTTRTASDEPDAVYGSGASSATYDAETSHFAFKGILTPLENQRLIIGVETEREMMSSVTDFGFGVSALNGLHARTTGVYGLAQLSAANNLFVTVGLRNDNHERFGNHTSARVTSSFMIPVAKLRLKASYGDGFNAPSLFQLFDPSFGNSGLAPEESESWDFGIERRFSNEQVAVGVTWFHQSLKNLFGFEASTFQTINIASARSQGAEVFGELRLRRYSVRMDYSYTDAVDRSDGSSLLRRAKNKVSLEGTFTPNATTSASFQIRHVGPRPDNDFETFPSQRVSLASYTIVGLTAQREVFDGVVIMGRVENLFDEKYQEVLHYSTSGRAAYFGVRYTI